MHWQKDKQLQKRVHLPTNFHANTVIAISRSLHTVSKILQSVLPFLNKMLQDCLRSALDWQYLCTPFKFQLAGKSSLFYHHSHSWFNREFPSAFTLERPLRVSAPLNKRWCRDCWEIQLTISEKYSRPNLINTARGLLISTLLPVKDDAKTGSPKASSVGFSKRVPLAAAVRRAAFTFQPRLI